jgi:hypothetical protein
VVDVTAYSELSAFQFQSGKGYDKRSVEHFKALSLGAVDELLREVTQLRNQLIGATEAAPVGVVLNGEEELLLGRFRSADDETRKVMLIGRAPTAAFGSSAAPTQAPIGFDLSQSSGAGFGTFPPTSPAAPTPYVDASWNATPTWTQDTPPSPSGWASIEPEAEAFSDPSDPDAPEWLRALAPDLAWSEPAPAVNEPLESLMPPIVAVPEPAAPEPTMPEPVVFEPAMPEPLAPAALVEQPLPPVVEPPGWSELPSWSEPAGWSEPAVAETVASHDGGVPADGAGFNPSEWDLAPSEPVAFSAVAEPSVADANRQLDELFNQLDFGPPPAGVLEAAGSFADAPGQGLALPGSAAPLRVELPSDQPQRLPTPTPPWSGWIKPQA